MPTPNPRRARATAAARPMPLDPPVTSATRSVMGLCSEHEFGLVCYSCSPVHDTCAPREPSTERGQHDDVAVVQAPGRDGIGKRERYGGCRRVADARDVRHQFLCRKPEPLSDRAQDPRVCLMSNEQIDVVGRYSGGKQDLAYRRRHTFDGALVDLSALHMDHAGLGWNVEELRSSPVCVKSEGTDVGPTLHELHNCGACTIAEQRAGLGIALVGDPR